MAKTSCRSRKVSRREGSEETNRKEKGGVLPLCALYSLDLTQIFLAREESAVAVSRSLSLSLEPATVQRGV
jgi:hypothetical protein